MLRTGWKTTEFWTGVITTLFVTIQQAIWPDRPFPAAEFGVIITWIAARIGEKTLGPSDVNGKRAWETSEFWVVVGFAVVKRFVDIPESVINLVYLWIVGRPVAKITTGVNIPDLISKTYSTRKPFTPQDK